ncbi:MAG TPA: hypothetical protein VF173_14370 [Thermoanaerobaculia bacterium]|nr:hypothetical protein [Thermoanaerobaculia bacterium]
MDALAWLALMTKAKLVFESPDTFMSFPALSPVSYTADQLTFGAFDSPAVAERLVYSEFARLVNALPTGTIFDLGEKFLWDTYASVLRTAILAQSLPTEAEEAAYQQAIAFLTGKDGFGESPQRLAYKQFRDVWFQAVQSYKTEQSTAAAATDPAVRTQWKETTEPRLRAAVEQARADWEAKGYKGAVEQAQQVQQTYAARSPQLMWHTWSSSFDPDLDLLTDPNQQPFAPTSFVPADVFAQEWPTFTITREEIAHLVSQAPQELKEIFAPEGSQSTLDHLSFEYRSVALARPWFRREVFDARCWRLPEGSPPLSDGAEPPQGTWPAYIAALVFVRNIQVTMHTDHAAAPPQPIRALPALQFVMQPRLAGMATMRLAPVAAAPPPVIKPANVQMLSNVTMRPVLRAAVVQPAPQLRGALVRDHRLPVPPGAVLPPVRPAPAAPTPVVPAPAAPPPPPVPAADPRKDVSVLAFLCKRLPKTPDPDESLSWSAKPGG